MKDLPLYYSDRLDKAFLIEMGFKRWNEWFTPAGKSLMAYCNDYVTVESPGESIVGKIKKGERLVNA
jgi:hypothetical protein